VKRVPGISGRELLQPGLGFGGGTHHCYVLIDDDGAGSSGRAGGGTSPLGERAGARARESATLVPGLVQDGLAAAMPQFRIRLSGHGCLT
jgi:hypothetical protein